MQHEYITTYQELDRLVTFLLSNPNDWLGCDTETTGLDCHTCVLSTVQISSQSLGHTYVIDVFKIPDWTSLFTRLTAQKKFNWAFHNFKFDLKFFWKVGIDFQHCKVVDTMIVSGLLTAGLNMDNDLKSVADRYLNIQLDKEEQRSDWSKRPLSDSQIYYAAMDADTTRLLGKKLVKLVKSEDITEVFKLEMRALPSFASMEYYGTQLDLVKLEHLRPIYEEKLRVAREAFLDLIPGRYVRYNCLGNIVDEGLDLKSPSQVLQVLRDAGVPNPLYDPKGRKPETIDPLLMSTGSNTLKLLNVTDYVLLENLMAYRKASKLLDAYIYSLPKLINPVTGRLHTHFRQSVSTGRASSSSPNLQNLSRPDGSETNLRSCFTPTEGYVLLDGDFSQIELRVVAEVIYKLSNDRKMLDEFIAGKDPYVATAALLSGMRYEDMIDDTDTVLKVYKLLRQQAKAVRLGFNYCLAGDTLVPTDKGMLHIKDIKIGDKVLTHTGNYRDVTDTQKVYTDELVKVTTSTGKVLTMTPDHKLLVMGTRHNRQFENEYRWVDACNLIVGNYLVPNSAEYMMPDKPYFTDSAHVKMLGWFLSEGAYSNGLFYIAQCPTANPVIHKEMWDTLEPLGFFRYAASLDRFYVHKKFRAEFMRYINVNWKARSRKKSFQSIRELLTRNERLALLGALWDGDGCISISNSKVSITYHSLSITLMRDIQYLLGSLGLNSRVYKRQTGLYDLRIIGSRSMRKFLDIIPTSKTLKAKDCLPSSVRTEEKISKIERFSFSAYPMYDITVDTDHSFIANGIVSHNCMGAPKFKSYAKTTYGVTFTEQEAAANRAMYFNSYPGLTVYHNTFKDKGIRVVHTLPPFKRPRYFADYPGIPALSNHPVQGTSADIQKLAMAMMYEQLHALGYSPTQSHDMRQICTIHDEIVSEALPHLAVQCANIQESCMVGAAKFILEHCPIEAEVYPIANLAMK